MRLPALLFLLAVAAAAQDPSGSITGVVQDAASHQPIKKAVVSITSRTVVSGAKPSAQGKDEGLPTMVTDASGAFAFQNLAAGQYQITVIHPNYPQSRTGGVRKSVQLSTTDSTPSITVELIPGAAISGHIVDEDGDPMTGCFIQPHPAKNVNQGVPITMAPLNAEDGAYRLAGIPPGKYIVSAQCTQTVFQPRPLSEGPDPPPNAAYPMLYYPAARDVKSADAIELTPGVEKSGVDFQMRPVAVTHIHGNLVAGSADWHGRGDLRIQLVPVDASSARGIVSTGGGEIGPDGSFDLRGVFPGSYRLIVSSQDFSARDPRSDGANRVGATLRVDVTDKPLEVSLPLQRAIDISGKVEIERGNDTTFQLHPNQISINLMSPNPAGRPPSPVQVAEDGTFTINSVLPGEWRIRAFAPSGYMKSAWLGSDDVTSRPMDLSSGTAAPLRILISTKVGAIHGTAPAGQTVMVAPLSEDDAMIGWRVAQADANGQFDLPGVPPGKYRAVLGEGPPPAEGGQEVTVVENETATVDVKPESKPQ